MDAKLKILEALDGLVKKAPQLDLANQACIVEIGGALEQVAQNAGWGSPLAELSGQMLKVLQAAFGGELADLPAAQAALAQAINAASDLANSRPASKDSTAAAMGNLRAILTPPATATPSETSTADAQAIVSTCAARLVSLSTGDAADLTEIRDSLLAARLTGVVCVQVKMAAKLIGEVIATPDGSESKLEAASKALEVACQVLERTASENLRTEMESSETEESAPVAAAIQPTAMPVTPAPAIAESVPTPTAPVVAAIHVAQSNLPADVDVELLKEYVVESLDHINSAEGALLELETAPDDGEHINKIFRAFHTIKGTSGFLGLSDIQRLAHLAENLLDRARGGAIHMVGGYADLALQSCDLLKGMIENLKGLQGGDELEIPDGLVPLLERLTNPEAVGVSEEGEELPLRLGEILAGAGKVEAQTVESTVQEGGKPIGMALVDKGQVSASDVAKALRTQKRLAGTTSDSTVRVGVDRLDSLINMVGELVIAQSMVSQDPSVTLGENPRLARNVSHAGKIVRELQDLTMALRMVPLHATFQKMQRLVRDLAHKSGKNVQFVTEGEDTEIDRNMVEVLNDPLIHMIRNSVDHGIESAEVRAAKGKAPVGTVRLRAYHSAGNVAIELSDDGKGLDRERILAKARERNLIDSHADLSDSEAFNLIFLPGFSTAEKITEVSGRGVGMDVVKRSVEALRGRIDIASRMGQGSSFTLRLPLTMAITDGMLLRVGNERYLLPTVSIVRSFRPAAGSVSTVTGRGESISLRGELLPLFRMHRLFNVPDAISNPYQGLVVVIDAEGKRCGLMVDELLGQQQVVIKSLGQSMGRLPGISGGAILGDGRVGLILDAAAVAAMGRGSETGAVAA